jgi:unsaturated chondroitin disaccharide hydrolase
MIFQKKQRNNTWFSKIISLPVIFILLYSCAGKISQSPSSNDLISYCDAQARKTVNENPADNLLPVVIDSGKVQWTYNDIHNWRSGFWPGIEWYLFESTKNEFWKKQAEKSTAMLSSILAKSDFNHDLGFQFYCSYGNGYRLTSNQAYKQVLLRAADSLETLFNPNVGTILSWPGRYKELGTPHNTIIDNMMNLELLFWAAKNGGDKKLYDVAVRHATTTMKNHFRSDFSTYHVLLYDNISGNLIKGITHQGYADNSMWARGQSWAIYGFTMTYRETGNKEFLQTAINAANTYLKRLPEDHIPYWDFDDPAMPNAPRDASAAAIVASALLELSTLCNDVVLQKQYKQAAAAMINELSSERYLGKEVNHAILLHSTGNKPSNKDVDVPLIYADYYFLEALLRLNKMK